MQRLRSGPVFAALAVAAPALAASPGNPSFTPTATTDLTVLETAVREHAPALYDERVAVATLRADGAQALRAEARNSLKLARDRLSAGFGSPLDVDRAEIDLYRIDELVMADEGEQQLQLAACVQIVARPCGPFADAA